MKEIKDETDRWEDIPLGLEESILSKCLYYNKDGPRDYHTKGS